MVYAALCDGARIEMYLSGLEIPILPPYRRHTSRTTDFDERNDGEQKTSNTHTLHLLFKNGANVEIS